MARQQRLSVPLGSFPAGGGISTVFSGGAAPAATQFAYSDGTVLKGDSGATRGTLAVTFDANTDNTLTTGYGRLGLATSGTSTSFYIAQASNYNSTDFCLLQSSLGTTVVNAKSGQTVIIRNANATAIATFSSTSVAIGSSQTVTIANVTASSGTGTGALVVTGGAGIGGQLSAATGLFNGGNVTVSAGRYTNSGTTTTQMATGGVGFWRSGGTIGAAGDMVLQSDLAGNGSFIFRSGTTTPVTVAAITGIRGECTLGVPSTAFTGSIIAGVQSGAAATAGCIGEVITSTVSGAAVAATGTVGNITSISLTPGDWLITGQAIVTGGATGLTSGTACQMSIVTTTATNGTAGSTMTQESVLALLSNGLFPLTLPGIRVNISASASYFLTEQVSFAAGSPTVSGTITATRIR